MVDQDIFALWPQILTELIVYLGRPAVQLQLGVVFIMLIVAVVMGRAVKKRLHMQFQDEVKTAVFGKTLIYQLCIQLTNSVLALILIQLARVVLSAQDMRTALIDALLRIIIQFLLLKVVLAVAIAASEGDGIQQYQRSLIIPLFVVLIGGQFIRIFFNSERLVDAPVFYLFGNTITLTTLFLITVGFYLWVVGIQAFGEGVHYLATRYGGADSGSTQGTLTLLRYILIIIGFVYVLFRLNFNTTTIAAISGGLSVGIGFAMSTILSNFVSGILLLFEGTLRPGDIIEYNGILCTVEMITIRSIRILTFDNVEMVIPNSEFMLSPFTTYTGNSKDIRLRIPIGVSYDDDHKHVIKTLLDVVAAHPLVMKDPEPEVRLINFGDFSIDYQIYVWVDSPMVSAEVKNELHQAILVAFAEQGITIPFPTAIEIIRNEEK